MAFAHKVNRFTAFGSSYGGDEEWSTGFWFGQEGADAATPTQATANAVLAAWKTFFENATSSIAGSFKTVGVRVTRYGTDGVMEAATNFYAYPTVPFAGGGGTLQLPAQVSLVASLQARPDRGLAAKGRMFLPGVNEAVGTDGRISTTRTLAIATNLDTMFTALNGHIDVGGYLINASKGGSGVGGPAPINRRVEDILVGNVYDTQRGTFWGAEQEFIADSQLDNLASCHSALTALLANPEPDATCITALFDHEEVGSESAVGAGGSFIADVLDRIATQAGLDGEGKRCAIARSFFVSADMAHGWHPNFPAAYEPHHRVLVNSGPVIKSNANQRYSTGAESAARFIGLCEQAGVPVQQYSHRTDLGCGSTIGPIVAARLGMQSIDVGCPMWAMHSLRESAGVLDHGYMIQALTAVYAS